MNQQTASEPALLTGPALTRAVHDRIRRDRSWILEPLLIDTVLGALTDLGYDPAACARTLAAEHTAVTLAARVDTLHTHVIDEQVWLWSDLERELGRAANGVWSIAAEDTARRVVAAARLVGPTPVEGVPWTLTAGGVWAALLAAGGVPHVQPSPGTWEALEGRMVAQGTRAEHGPRWAATCEAIARAGRDGAFDPDDSGGDGRPAGELAAAGQETSRG